MTMSADLTAESLFKSDYSENELIYTESDIVAEIARREELPFSQYKLERLNSDWDLFSRAIDDYFSKQIVACLYFDKQSGRCGRVVSWSRAICCKGFKYSGYYSKSALECSQLCSDFISGESNGN